MKSIRLRGGMGLGDALYVRAIAEELIRRGYPVTALTNYADVFIGSGCALEPFRRNDFDVLAHYIARKGERTNQWEDVCISARLAPFPMRISWTVQNAELVARIRRAANGRPVVLVHGGREPMARGDGYGMELLPEACAFGAVCAALADCLKVSIGAGSRFYAVECDLDLWGETTVAEVMDLASICDALVAPCSFCLPLAEGLDKPFLAVWSAKSARSPDLFIRRITPAKLLSKGSSLAVYDDAPHAQIVETARRTLRLPEPLAA